ncbi:MAG: recombinase family protein [Anaerolineae bacterium]|nr:MAG: recombinase family protein [Anaerolineae bacterium]
MQDMNEPQIALCYVRQTGIGKNSQAAIERQQVNILHVCEVLGWEPEWYEDVDEPGIEAAASERLAWEALQERFGAPDVAALVVDDLTRLHRDPNELDALMQTLDEYGIQLVTAASMGLVA